MARLNVCWSTINIPGLLYGMNYEIREWEKQELIRMIGRANWGDYMVVNVHNAMPDNGEPKNRHLPKMS